MYHTFVPSFDRLVAVVTTGPPVIHQQQPGNARNSEPASKAPPATALSPPAHFADRSAAPAPPSPPATQLDPFHSVHKPPAAAPVAPAPAGVSAGGARPPNAPAAPTRPTAAPVASLPRAPTANPRPAAAPFSAPAPTATASRGPGMASEAHDVLYCAHTTSALVNFQVSKVSSLRPP
jgi:cytoskeleton protein RodZ